MSGAILISVGCLGNCLTMMILKSPSLASAFHSLLIWLCCIDSFFLLTNITTTFQALGYGEWFCCPPKTSLISQILCDLSRTQWILDNHHEHLRPDLLIGFSFHDHQYFFGTSICRMPTSRLSNTYQNHSPVETFVVLLGTCFDYECIFELANNHQFDCKHRK